MHVILNNINYRLRHREAYNRGLRIINIRRRCYATLDATKVHLTTIKVTAL